MLTLYILAPLATLAMLVWLSHRTGHRAYPLKMRRVDAHGGLCGMCEALLYVDAHDGLCDRCEAHNLYRQARQTLLYAQAFGTDSATIEEEEAGRWD